MKNRYPTTTQANLMFLIISLTILLGSSILIPILGIGANTWINEYLWILAPTLLLVKLGKMPSVEVFKLKKVSKYNIIIGMLAAVCMWFFAFYISKLSEILLDSSFGTINLEIADNSTSLSQSILIMIGMLVLAPICEELLFRGVIQSAFEQHNKKYGFVMAGILFGMFHVLNGVTQVIPTLLTGLLLGYLVYRTGSIAASMFAHFAFNASALFINGAMGLSFISTIPIWLHILCLCAPLLSIFLLSRLKEEEMQNIPGSDNPDENDSGLDSGSLLGTENTSPVSGKKYYTRSTYVLFVISWIFVFIIGAIEIYARQMQ